MKLQCQLTWSMVSGSADGCIDGFCRDSLKVFGDGKVLVFDFWSGF